MCADDAAVAEALHDIHQQHVIHLDLKPSNVIQRNSEGVVLIDFGCRATCSFQT